MFDHAAHTFRSNCNEVERLLKFDQDVLASVITLLEGLHNDLKTKHLSDQMNGGRVLQMVRNIRDNDSLKSRYDTVHSQAVVLLVSHFASALGDIFRTSIASQIERDDPGEILNEEIKLTFRDMREKGWNLKDAVPELLIEKKDIKFQDMQSVVRAFKDYAGITLDRDDVTNDIIVGQAARHVIVHDGGRINERMVRQVSGARPRSLKQVVAAGEVVRFESAEVLHLMRQMLVYVDRVIGELRAVS